MDYEKLHKDTITKLQEMVNSGKITVEVARVICADFVPESEDERIRKEMIFYFTEEIPQCSIQEHADKMKEFISWLKRLEVERTKLELKAGNSYFCYKSRWERADSETFKKGLIYKCNKDGVLDNFVIKNPEQHFIEIKNECIAWLEKQTEKKSSDDVAKEVIKSKDAAVSFLKSCGIMNENGELSDEYKIEQGEKKPADKVEPKFKVGDWLVHDMSDGRVTPPVQIIEMTNKSYVLDNGECFYFSDAEEIYRKWTIQDAKDGDVLAAHECYVIFKEIDGLNIKCYCTYHYIGFNPSFYVDTLQNRTAFYPATKEQRELLFQKMREAGYTFSFEKKELKKIEQKPTWSEEDEAKIVKLKSFIAQCNGFNKENRNKVFDLIDSIKFGHVWKPSDEQMNAFDAILVYNPPCSNECRNHLITLYNELKKLREE